VFFRFFDGFKVFSMTCSLSMPGGRRRILSGWWNLAFRLAKSLLLFVGLLIAFAAPAQQDFNASGASISEQEYPRRAWKPTATFEKAGHFLMLRTA